MLHSDKKECAKLLASRAFVPYVLDVPCVPTCLRAVVPPCIYLLRTFLFLRALRALMFLRVLRVLLYYVLYVSSFLYVLYVPSIFVRALRAFTFLSASSF